MIGIAVHSKPVMIAYIFAPLFLTISISSKRSTCHDNINHRDQRPEADLLP